jgi:DNA-binding NarL/FixJ family response regulator
MAASDDGQYDDYQRLACEYQDRVNKCLASLEDLRQKQREFRNVAGARGFDAARIDAVSEIEKSLNQILGSSNGAAALPIEELSPRELAVFRAIGEGLTSHEIAERLGVAISTIETYRERLKTKLSLPHGTALIRCAILWSMHGS